MVAAVMDRAALRKRVQHALFVLGNVHVDCARRRKRRAARPGHPGGSRRRRLPAKPPSGQRATISFILPSGVVNAADVPLAGGFVKIWGRTPTISGEPGTRLARFAADHPAGRDRHRAMDDREAIGGVGHRASFENHPRGDGTISEAHALRTFHASIGQR